MAKTATPEPSRARSAITGRYVTKSYAKSHPRTTVIERDSKK